MLQAWPGRGSEYVFLGPRGAAVDMAMRAVCGGWAQRRHRARLPFDVPRLGGRAHRLPNDVVEMALAHVVGDKVEAAYRRGDLFEKRRKLMAEWAPIAPASRARRAARSCLCARGAQHADDLSRLIAL